MPINVGAHALIINDQNKVLITKRSESDGYMPLLWDLPGGSIEIGETVEEALIREVKEETNIDILPVKPVYVHTDLSFIPHNHNIQIVYKCVCNGGDILLDPEEHVDYQWVEYNDIPKYKCIAFLVNLLINYNFETDNEG